MSEQVKLNTANFVGKSFFEFLTIMMKYRWFLFWFVLIITTSATIYALFAPKWFKSSTSVLLAEKNDLLSSLSGLGSLAKGFSASKGLAALTGGNSEADKYMAILKSSTLTDEVIKKFKLREEYNLEDDYYEKTVKEWESNVQMEVQDEGNLTIVVLDKDPKKSSKYL